MADSPFLPYFRGLPLTTGYAEGGLYVRRFGSFSAEPGKSPRTTGKVYRVADQDTLTVEIPVTFGEDGYVLLMICPEGSTDLTSNVYPLLIVLAAE